MTDRELYTKGAKVWVPHAESVWEGASVEDDYLGSFLHLQTDGGFKKKLVIKSDADLPPLRNPSILIGENDLTTLSYLHEPAVLYNLKYRFCENKAIYTYCGIVLVAVNPYAELSLYGPDSIMAYRSHSLGDLEPHIFAVAEEAYTKLEREQRNQSIIVSGESGAGKTVSAKYAMRYFASVGGSDTETQVERKVLASSPIMEAIGNAKTTRNDNSSRFGKFTELLFNQHLHITGASMRTYLLEKSRVIFQAPGEQSYHIFYQLCSARDELPHLLIGHQDTFNYLNQGCLSSEIEKLSDFQSFVEFCTALSTLGFSKHEQDDMFKVWAAILHLGNITFVQKINEDNQEKDTDSSDVLMSDLHLSAFCSLLDIDPVQMRNWLCKRQIVSMHEHILKPMSIDHSENARDALAKHMYAKMFDWVVKIINKSLDCPGKSTQFIGVLDIYGFETFDTNSFEQFCINYANEKLQQQFNRHVFKLEQEEYLKEGIEWTMIDFYDNQPCIDLIESKLGILNLLDEECTMPKGSDSSWAEKLYSKCVKYKHFVKPRFGSSAFSVNHFADLVQYESFGFLEKNRDTVLEEQIGVLRRSNNRLVCKLFEEENTKLKVPGVKMKISAQKPVVQAKIKQHKQSVGSQFRDSLSLLMTTLDATTPHYVRCIKPNDFKEPFSWNPSRAVQQLRACGVLETIRISAAGFPSRWNYFDFFARYRVLCKSDDINRKDMMTTCHKILSERITAADKFKFGKTIIFFRAGQVAYLEKLRAEQLCRCCIIMQSQIRAYIQRQKYLRLQRTANGLQRHIRGLLARRKAIMLRQIHAATTIQRYARGYLNRRNYKMLRRTVLGLQRYGRGLIARRHYKNMLYNSKAIIIQKNVRGWLARLHYKKIRQQIIICQSAVRRFLARRRYKKLKAEARSVEHVKKLNKGLENKIISLQQKIQEHNKVTTILKCAQNEVIELKSKLEQMRALENEVKKLKALLHDSNNSVANLQERIKINEDEKMLLVEQQQNVMIMLEEERLKFNMENESLRHELQALSVNSKSKEKDNEVNMQIRLDEARDLLDRESEQEKAAYQRLLQDYNALESRADEMQEQLARSSRTAHTSKHIRSLSDVSNTSDALPIPDSFQVTEAAETIVDVSLLLKLQQKLHIVEVERARLAQRNEELEKDTPVEDLSRAEDRFRLTELEMENEKLKTDLQLLRQSVFENSGKGIEQKELMEQFRTLQEELDRRRDECIQLRSVLANQSSNLRSFGLNYSANDVDIVNEDGELVQAFEAQKKVNRQLVTELQYEKTRFKDHEMEIENLRSDNERQQKLLSGNLGTSENQTEAYMQYEITRLTSENLDLQELNDTTTETCRKYKKQLRLLQKRLKEAGLNDALETLSIAEKSGYPGDTPAIGATQSQLPAVRKKDREVQGMFEYKMSDEPIIIKRLVYDLKPRVAVTLLPCLPAYILFMCIRHTDLLNDDIKVRTILGSFINAVKKVIKKRSDNLELAVLWLANMLRLLHNLKQYSGDKAFQKNNTPRQNEQCLRNFDLSEYRQVTSDIAVWIYQCIIRHLEERIQPLIVPAILEHEAISGLSGHKPAGMRGRSSSVTDGSKPLQNAPVQLVSELTSFLKTLGFYGVDPELIVQIFKQLFYFICASSLNNLLLRKDLCHWSKGTQIRYNLSHLESWTRDQKLEESTILATLQPIIQAAHLLQARKSEEDIQSVCEMCPKLTAQQICKILNLYTPADEYESRVSISFIRKLQTKLEERASQSESECQNTLLMDSKVNFPVRFPFNPSGIRLEDIEIPEIINLPMLIKI